MYVYKPYIFALCRIEPRGVLYVRQKQWGVTHKGDTLEDGQEVISRIFFFLQFSPKNRAANAFQVLGCGTDDVLTCHVIVLREPELGVAAIGHFDEFSRKKNFDGLVATFLDRVRQRKRASAWDYWDEGEGDWEWEEDGEEQVEEEEELDPSAVYELHLVGGYADDAGKSQKISQRFFHHLHSLSTRLELVTCCLGRPNTRRRSGEQSQPVISGIHLNLNTGQLLPAEFHRTFTDFQPDIKNVLLIFPPLTFPGQKKKSSLKQMIVKQEDRGFAKSQFIYEYNNVYLP